MPTPSPASPRPGHGAPPPRVLISGRFRSEPAWRREERAKARDDATETMAAVKRKVAESADARPRARARRADAVAAASRAATAPPAACGVAPDDAAVEVDARDDAAAAADDDGDDWRDARDASGGQLPAGWMVRSIARARGGSTGRVDRTWAAPRALGGATLSLIHISEPTRPY